MRRIDVERWKRREHFRLLRTWTHPHFCLTANVDLTAFYPAVKARGASFNVAAVYVVTRAANTVPALRQRMRGEEQVVEHDVVHPSTTILLDDDTFTFCMIEYVPEFPAFSAEAARCIQHAKEHPTVEDPPRDDLLFMTAIPWVSFTHITHAIHLDPPDCIPRIAWGKYFREGERLKMPVSLLAHHALVDGLHAGRWYEEVQRLLDDPEWTLGQR